MSKNTKSLVSIVLVTLMLMSVFAVMPLTEAANSDASAAFCVYYSAGARSNNDTITSGLQLVQYRYGLSVNNVNDSSDTVLGNLEYTLQGDNIVDVDFYWMYSEAKYHSGDPDYLGRLLDSAKELSQIAPAVISGEDLPDWTPDISASRGISRLLCALDGRVYVLVGPSDPEQRGRLRFELPAGIRAKLLFEAPERTWEGPERVKITVPRRRVKLIELSS